MIVDPTSPGATHMIREIRMRTEVQREDVVYEVYVDNVLKWSKRVMFGRGEHHGPGGTLFQLAAREQESIARDYRTTV